MPDTLAGGGGLLIGRAVGHVGGDITCHFDETYLVGRCLPVANRRHVGRYVIHLRHDITLRTGMQDADTFQQETAFRVVVRHALHVCLVGDVDTCRQAFDRQVERFLFFLVQADGGRTVHDESVVVARSVIASAERHRSREGTDRYAVQQSLPGNDLGVVVVFGQVGDGDDVGLVACAGGQVYRGGVALRRVGGIDSLQLHFVREVFAGLSGFGGFIHLHAFGIGMHEESQAVDAFLVVGGIVQQAAYCTGFHTRLYGSRQARHPFGQRVTAPADLLHITTRQGGECEEQKDGKMFYSSLFHILLCLVVEKQGY
ncbi:hypothetical protein H8S77_27815 [Parabacteroides sp. BX2]|uniref:Uncharacterized protein n=2 Tax=Parabacteroides TaxID=375288 RepID=A0ABR7EA71_9BACT|nr:hypothetical protein [Parabacteroides segnis]MBC5646662.1 hypothetical protein [Parabacteroides segnis]